MANTAGNLFPHYPAEDQRRDRAALSRAVRRVLESGHYILGEEVAGFEAEFARFLGVSETVGVASGTDAIELMLRALDIGREDKVVVPAHAPSAVAAGVLRSGADVVYADIEEETFTLCPESLDAVLSSPAGRGVKAALVVHLYGHPADWKHLRIVADAHNVMLLEDCAQAHGAMWHGRRTGTLGRAAAFSFYPTKNLAAMGDAGAVASDDPDLVTQIRLRREYGWAERFISSAPGVNSRLDEIQAAVLRMRLPNLQRRNEQRRRLAAHYDARLRKLSHVRTPVVRGGCEHACHQYVIRTRQRDGMLSRLRQARIPAAVHYPVPLHQQAAFARPVSMPVAERAVTEILSLPLHPYLSERALDAVCEIIQEARP